MKNRVTIVVSVRIKIHTDFITCTKIQPLSFFSALVFVLAPEISCGITDEQTPSRAAFHQLNLTSNDPDVDSSVFQKETLPGLEGDADQLGAL